MRRVLKRGLIGLLVVIALLTGSTYLLVSTEWGTEWLYARAKPYLPEPLELENLGGTLLSELTVEQLRWLDDGVDVAVDDLSVSIELRPLLKRHLAVTAVTAQRVLVVSTPTPPVAPSDEPVSIDIPLTISVESARVLDINVTTTEGTKHLDRIDIKGEAGGAIVDLSHLSIASDWLTVDGEVRVRLSPPYDADGSIKWTLEDIGATSLAGTLHIDGDNRGYQLDHSLSLPVAVETEGTLRLDGDAPQVNLDNRWEMLDWPIDDKRMLHSTQGSLKVSGGVNRYIIEGDASLQLGDWPETMVAINGEGNTGEFNLTSLQADSTIARLSASGDVNWESDPRWAINFKLAELAIDHLLADVSGLFNAEGLATGQLPADESLEMELRIERLSGTLNDYPVGGAMTILAQQGNIEIANSSISVRRNHFSGNGRVSPRIDLAFTWDMPAIDELLPSAAGQSRGSVRVKQSDAGWLVSGNATAADMAWQEYSIASLAAGGDVSTYGPSDTSLQLSKLQINDLVIDSASSRISGLATDHHIELNATSLDRKVTVKANGGYQDRRWVGQLEQLRFDDGDRSAWLSESAAALRIADTGIGLETLCLQEITTMSRLCSNAEFLKDGPLQASVTLENLPLAQLPLTLPSDDIDVAGSVAADIDVSWMDNLLNASASLRLDDARFTADYEGEVLAATLERGVANVTVTDNAVSANAELLLIEGGGATARLSIGDIMDSQSVLEGNGTLEVTDLSFVPLFLPAVSDTRGTMAGTLSIGGRLDAPTMGGDLALVDGAFRGNNAGVVVTDIGLQLTQDVNGQLSLTGTARSGDGHLAVSGNSRLDSESGLAASINITGENFEIIRLPEWQAVASPDIQLTMDRESARIRGKLDVPAARIVLNTVPESAESVSPDAVVHGRETVADSATRRFDIDVAASLGDDVYLSAFGLDTGLTGALRLRGSSQEPFVGTGRIELQDGRYKAYGQELDIESGALLFSGPLDNPALDVRATRKVDDVVAGLILSGTPSELRSTVFSEPPLSDAEALSYLIAGRPLAAADEQESNRVGQAAFALGLKGAEKVIAQVQSKLGLDSLSIGSGDDVGRIVAGRRIGGRLMVEYGYGLVDRLGTLLLRYQLNNRIVVETTTGTASTLDVVYSVKKE